MKKLYLFMVALFVAIAANANFRVYFENKTVNWSPVKIHYWGGTTSTSWSGVDMVHDSGTLYYYDVPDGTNGIIFNNGSDQTGDIKDDAVIANHVYEATGSRGFADRGDYDTYTSGGGETASYTYYFDGPAFGDWGSKDFKLELVDGKYTKTANIKVNDKGFGIARYEVVNGNETNSTWFYCPTGETNTIEGTPYSSSVVLASNNNGANWVSKISGEYTFTFDPDAMTFSIAQEAPTYPDLYVRNTTNGENYLMTETNGIYTVTIDELSGSFKIADDGWNAENMFGSATITDNFSGTLTGKDNMTIADGKTLLNATFTFNYSTKLLQVTGTYKVDQPEEPTAEYYVYFENTGNWSKVYAHAWKIVNGKDEFCTASNSWPGDLLTEKTADGRYYIWKLPEGKNIPEQILFNPGGDDGKTANMPFFNKASYTGNSTYTRVDIPSTARIYFNASADWYNPDILDEATNDGGVMHYKLRKPNGEYTAREKMVPLTGDNVQLPLFYVDVENLQNYTGILFDCIDRSNNTVTYEGHKSGETAYDAENWWKYIYTTGNGGRAQQTYLTFDEYETIRNAAKPTVYFLGSGFNTYKMDENGNFNYEEQDGKVVITSELWDVPEWDTKNLVTAAESEGVFILPINFKSNANDIKFKMSWINPNVFKAAIGAKDDNSNVGDDRWWATFNLGLVGPTLAPDYYKLANNDTKKALELALNDNANGKTPGAYKFDDGYAISYIINRARTYSRYNQYNWWISDKSLNLPKDNTRYIVIDTEYKTTATIPFRPAPGLSDVKSSVAKMYDQDLDAENATIIGNQLKGAEIAGLPQIVKINQSTGTATIQVSKGISLYDYNYTVTYYLYHGDNVIAEIEGVPNADKYEVSLANMAAGQGEELKVRCLYYDHTNDTKFRSRTESEKIVDNRKFAAPVLNDYKTTFFRDGAGWHAQVDADFTIDARNGSTFDYTLATYPDFEFVEHGYATSVRLATSEDDHVKWDIAKPHHTKWTEGETYVPETHNWSTIALGAENNGKFENGHIKFVFENIAGPEVEELPESRYEFKVNMIAAYPFLINNNSNDITVTIKNAAGEELDKNGNVIAKAARKAADRVNSYSVAMNNMPTEFTFASDVNGNLSGINDVEMGEEGESVLYTLQGIRVEGDAAPGIYLRRTGSKTQKVVIR